METSATARAVIAQNRERYRIGGWGSPYFDVNPLGHVQVTPRPDSPGIDLYELVQELEERGLDFPLLLRFPDILRHRIDFLNQCFARAIDEQEYRGQYRGVFPIKVNQQKHLIDEIVRAGAPWNFGLEAGSKPELLIALASMELKDGLIICNGYKDSAYIETALIAQKFDNTVLIVLEQPDELATVLEASDRLGIRPLLGVRAKLSSRGMGRWASSSGDKAKFGLTTSQILAVTEELRARDMLDCLRLLHFHIGSQISSITPWKNALREAGQLYVELSKLGCKMGFVDVGGGLAVDYDGSRSDFHASMNYGVQEYANDVVDGIRQACDRAGLEHPTLVSESGRAIASYQSILVFNALGTSWAETPIHPPADDAHPVLAQLWETYEAIEPGNLQESWHDVSAALEEGRNLFRYGYLSLKDVAQVEDIYWASCARIHRSISQDGRAPEELETLETLMGDILYCNFSVFQSAPDVWAMDQLFPIMPIHRLDEVPTERSQLADLTCDSDGLIKAFIQDAETEPMLATHTLDQNPYVLGIFLVGAYQEILGDLHNLFGDTHAVHIRVADDGDYEVEDVIKGDTVAEVLSYVQYNAEDMVERARRIAERSLKDGLINREQLRAFMTHYEASMNGYTYLRQPPR